uniref:Uncharacterized protein n=1 Tax=Rhizophora mucronata TaxID=61149 RepID=A0A2P2J4U9_RHIMU
MQWCIKILENTHVQIIKQQNIE